MRTPLRTLAGLVFSLAVVAGCGGEGGGGDDVATLGGDTGEESAAGGTEGGGRSGLDAEFQDAMVEFTECMRENGVDLPDPTFDGDGEGRMAVMIGPDGPGADPEKFEAANEACRHIMEEATKDLPQPSAEEIAEMRDRMLETAECMRDKGFDFPDPEFSDDGSVTIRGGPGGGGGVVTGSASARVADGEPAVRPAGPKPGEDDEFNDAMEECSPEGGPFAAGRVTSSAVDDQ